MKKILLGSFVALALGATSSAFAQAAGPAGGPPKAPPVGSGRAGAIKAMAKANAEMMAKLNLTPDQKAKIEAHQKAMALKRRELMKGATGAPGLDAAEKIQSLRKENQEFMKAILTPEQRKQYRQLRLEAMRSTRAKGSAAPTKP